RYQPALTNTDVTHAVPYQHVVAVGESAAAALVQDPRQALAAVELSGDGRPWQVRFDLLASGSDDTRFVVEVEADRRARLRFGDGVAGRRPDVGLTATYRIGGGTTGNVAAEALGHVVDDEVTDLSGIIDVRNPLPATG